MHTNMNPIEKHKNQIERRISQLQEKFKEKEGPKIQQRKMREYRHDENSTIQHQGYPISKTVQVRGKIRAQGQSKNIKQTAYFPSTSKQPLSETGVIKNIRSSKGSGKGVEQEKMKELYDMMKQILNGQKTIEKEINDLKKENAIRASVLNNNQTSFFQDQSPLEASLEKVNESKEKNEKYKSNLKKEFNQSILVKERAQSKDQRQTRQKKLKAVKQAELQAYLQEMREQNREGQRICVGEEWKARIWAEVQNRVKDSEKQYKDTIHRNNKHEFDHLTNTFQLQRKLKDDLIEKVYQQCNSQVYK